MSCSSCGPKPSCMKYMASVKTIRVPKIVKHLTQAEKEFWDPEIRVCTSCRHPVVDGTVPRFFWSPHYDECGTVMCTGCRDAMIARRL